MRTRNTPTNDTTPAPNDETPSVDSIETEAGSIRDRIRARRRALTEDVAELFDLPGFDGTIVVRYGLKTFDELAAAERAAEQHAKTLVKRGTPKKKAEAQATFYGQCNTLADACLEILVRRGTQLVPLANELERAGVDIEGINEHGPVQFDRRFAAYVADEGQEQSVRSINPGGACVRFGVPRDVAVATHYGEVVAWMRNGNDDANDEILGE